MIHVIKGDLLESDCKVIMHQANCYAKMGAGIARSIANKYPEAYEADKNFPDPLGLDRLGKFSYSVSSNGVVVFNLYGQNGYGRGTRTEYLHLGHALEDAINKVVQNSISKSMIKIGLPYGIGCGLAGGDWNLVMDLLLKVSTDTGVDLYLYKL